MATGGPREGTDAGTYRTGTAEPTAAGGGRGRGSGVAAALVGILVVAVAAWIVLAALDDSADPSEGSPSSRWPTSRTSSRAGR